MSIDVESKKPTLYERIAEQLTSPLPTQEEIKPIIPVHVKPTIQVPVNPVQLKPIFKAIVKSSEKETVLPKVSELPKASGLPKLSELPKASGLPKLSELPKASGLPKVPVSPIKIEEPEVESPIEKLKDSVLLPLSSFRKNKSTIEFDTIPHSIYLSKKHVKEVSDNKSIVTVNLSGGLGYWIFKILAGLGYADRFKKKFILCRNYITYGTKGYEKQLESKITRIFPELSFVDYLTNTKAIYELKEMTYSPLPLHNSNVVLRGNFNDSRYFPNNSLIPDIRTTYYPDTYFIHIRAGDYQKTKDLDIELKQYYSNCFFLLHSSIKYIVFSDDNLFAQHYMEQFNINYTLCKKEDPVEALIEMANCAGGICANSTFSWLGGFFQGETRGQIFMPSTWIKYKEHGGIYPSWATVVPVKNSLVHQVNKNNYKLADIKIIKIPSGRKLNYNACLIGNRLFFRAVNIVEQDDILTCEVDITTMECIPRTIKTLKLVSKFNNKHVEDPRVILHKGHYFVCYTDGYNIGIAKLDSNLDTLYSHYLKKPSYIRFEGGDGREKNWLPISMGDTIHFWYSDKPRTFLVYEDTGQSLEYVSFIKTEQSIRCNFGGIRGGCSPIPYDDDRKIWFFHTLFEGKYRIGAYLTKGLTVVSITPTPIITGNHIVFPCGVIQHDGYFYISMGVQDRDVGILKVSMDLEFVAV
jgi:hypothetical protein